MEPRDRPDIDRGRNLFGRVAASMLMYSAFVIYLTIRAGTFGPTQAVRFALTVLLLYGVWTGRDWARKVASLLCGIATFGFLWLSTRVDGLTYALIPPLVGIVVYGWCCGVLGFSPHLRTYLRYQAYARRRNPS